MQGLDREFFIRHSIDPDNETFISDILTEDYIGDTHKDNIREEGLEEEDWTGSF